MTKVSHTDAAREWLDRDRVTDVEAAHTAALVDHEAREAMLRKLAELKREMEEARAAKVDGRIVDVGAAYGLALAEDKFRDPGQFAGMTGPAYSVEQVGLPSPDAHAVAVERSDLIETIMRRLTDRTTDELRVIAYAPEPAPIRDGDYHPLPVRRSELVQQLDARRDNDVYILVPVEGREPVRLGIARVAYLAGPDFIALHTSPWYLGVEDDTPRWTPWLPLSAGEVERILCDTSGVRMQAQDTGDETTPWDLTVSECADDFEPCTAELDEDTDEECVLLVSDAFPGGKLHMPPYESVTVRIEVAA